MDATALEHHLKSATWNADTGHLVECISKGVDVSGLSRPDDGGWQRVGRYSAGKPSARVQASKIRKRWPNLEAKVRGIDGEEWTAEVWVRMKTETTG